MTHFYLLYINNNGKKVNNKLKISMLYKLFTGTANKYRTKLNTQRLNRSIKSTTDLQNNAIFLGTTKTTSRT